MMKILSHRGYWKAIHEKNTAVAFVRSFALDFGTETDVRDLVGEVVISHDPPSAGAMPLAEFVALHGRHDRRLPLALNVKADGLADSIRNVVEGRVDDWFVFDMSIPDTRQQLAAGNPVFVRMSEHEPVPPFLDRAAGVWLDGFERDWATTEDVRALLNRGLRVCVVSPELHGRAHEAMWRRLAPLSSAEGLMLCTDFPEVARAFFQGGEAEDSARA